MAGKKMYRGPTFKSPLCRVSYAQGLFKPRAMEEGQKPKFSATFIFLVADRGVFEKQLREALIGEWGEKGIERFKAGLIKNPLLAGDGKEARNKDTGEIRAELGADKFFIRPTAGEENPPSVWWKDPNLQETEENVYSGCYGKAILNMYTWHHLKSGDMVSIGLHGFQKLREGDRLGGERIRPDKYHETVEDMGDAPSETHGGAGAGGLFGS